MLFLLQDGITNGAIYALLGLALVLVFAVTRVILIPQGEFVTYGALTYATLASGQVPGTARLAVVMGIAAFGLDLVMRRRTLRLALIAQSLLTNIVVPAAILALTLTLAGKQTPIAVDIALSLLIVGTIGLYLYRIAFAPIAHTSVLVLLIAAVGCHLALQGIGLVFFGAEGQRGPALSNASFTIDPLRFTGQSIAVYAVTLALIAALWLLFRFTLYGKALARHRGESSGRAAGWNSNRAVGPDRISARRRDRRHVRHPHRPHHDALLRHWIPDRPEGLCRRDHRRPRQLSLDRDRRSSGWQRRSPSRRSTPATSRK